MSVFVEAQGGFVDRLERVGAALPQLASGEASTAIHNVDSAPSPSPAVLKAMDWLKEHPEHNDKSARAIAEMIGVSHTVIVKAKRLL